MKKQLILIRGAQGSGKSSTAAVWANWEKSRWYEADQLFTDMNGRYDFRKYYLSIAHEWCEDAAIDAMDNPDVERIVVSNCFIKAKHMERYIAAAKNRGIDVKVYVVAGKHENTHGVPEDVVEKCRADMEPWFGEHLYTTTSQGIRELVELYPKYKDVCIMLPDKEEGYDGFPWVAPRPGEEGFPKYALGEVETAEEE